MFYKTEKLDIGLKYAHKMLYKVCYIITP